MKVLSKTLSALVLASTLLLASTTHADTRAETQYSLTFKNHRIVPAELRVPAGQKIRLVIDNQDPTPEEFESHSLNREKIVPGNSKTVVFIGPLKPGSYDVFGEFNLATAQGRIIAE